MLTKLLLVSLLLRLIETSEKWACSFSWGGLGLAVPWVQKRHLSSSLLEGCPLFGPTTCKCNSWVQHWGFQLPAAFLHPSLTYTFSWKRYGLLLKIVVPKGYESTPPKSWGQGKPSSPPLFLSAETSTALSPPPELCNKDVSLLMPKWGLATGAEGASSFVP